MPLFPSEDLLLSLTFSVCLSISLSLSVHDFYLCHTILNVRHENILIWYQSENSRTLDKKNTLSVENCFTYTSLVINRINEGTISTKNRKKNIQEPLPNVALLSHKISSSKLDHYCCPPSCQTFCILAFFYSPLWLIMVTVSLVSHQPSL